MEQYVLRDCMRVGGVSHREKLSDEEERGEKTAEDRLRMEQGLKPAFFFAEERHDICQSSSSVLLFDHIEETDRKAHQKKECIETQSVWA